MAKKFLFNDAETHRRASLWTSLRKQVFPFALAINKKFQEDLISLRAMSLTYTTLLSLVPFLAVTFAVLKAFDIHNQIEPLLARAFAPLGPGGDEVTQRVVAFVNNLRVGVLGTVGMATLFYTVISLIGKIEDALNCIWRVRHPRSWTQRFRDYLSVVLVGPVLVFTAFALMASARSHWLAQWLLESRPLGFVVVIAIRVMPFLLLCTVFTFLYRFLPNTRVRFRSALVGGAVAAILWQLAGVGFAAFVANSASYAAIYSSFAILIIFLLWLNIQWLIVLVGGEIAYLHHYANTGLQEWLNGADSQTLRERYGLVVLIEITKRYLAGKPLRSPADLTATLGIPLSKVEDFLDACVKRGILLRAAEPEGITLGRPPEHVPAVEIFEVLRGRDLVETVNGRGGPVADTLYRRDCAVRQALEGVTLKSLASSTAGNAQAATTAAAPFVV